MKHRLFFLSVSALTFAIITGCTTPTVQERTIRPRRILINATLIRYD